MSTSWSTAAALLIGAVRGLLEVRQERDAGDGSYSASTDARLLDRIAEAYQRYEEEIGRIDGGETQ